MATDKQPDLDRPSPGRVYDFLLGGTNNYAVDREFAKAQLEVAPGMRDFARANRAFLGRAVRYAMGAGVRQFVDLGSGLPTQGNVHEVADEVAPGEARVVYVDNEPIAHAHARILLEDTADPARHRALHGDFFDRDRLWRQVLDQGVLDPDLPVCLLAVALLHFMPPEREPEHALAFYRDQLAPGSLLVLSHGSVAEADRQRQAEARKLGDNYAQRTRNPLHIRDRAEVTALFGDFELIEPGVVWLSEWRPEDIERDATHSGALAGVARRP
ncbi:SAM-dependent methyltransferase [Amycolatopsis cihanbeyliensis]|uniref:O-methyltransferase involved in polyketide biosynthesis n=1 Tax=Amycolatopsis cihanbeyliensis TaxID=1128664 RepID=A0A542CTN8_AMYCI|nr:SAM-dependent methyltransferase [Amycolatopsis cihanbeyliensis]TQI94150.1 O-methyltransferase involved in polyketide biosynthesis [Amycolatopsis cihanbeyliensis]